MQSGPKNPLQQPRFCKTRSTPDIQPMPTPSQKASANCSSLKHRNGDGPTPTPRGASSTDSTWDSAKDYGSATKCSPSRCKASGSSLSTTKAKISPQPNKSKKECLGRKASSTQFGNPRQRGNAQGPQGAQPAQAPHCDGLVAVLSTAFLQDVEPSWVVRIHTLLGEDVLRCATEAQSAEWMLGQPLPGSPGPVLPLGAGLVHARLPGMVQPPLLLLPHRNLGLLESPAARDPSVSLTHHFHTVWGAYTGVQGLAVHTRTLRRTEQGRGEGGGSERFDSPGMETWGKDLREEKEPSVERPGREGVARSL